MEAVGSSDNVRAGLSALRTYLEERRCRGDSRTWLPDAALDRLQARDLEVIYESDEVFTSEDAWLNDGRLRVKTPTRDGEDILTIQGASSRSTTSAAGAETEQLEETTSCKLLAPSEALRLLWSLADANN